MRRRPLKPGRKLPKFHSAREFVEFVERHDLAGYWDEFEEVKEPVEIDAALAREIDRRARRKQLISIRLEAWQVRLAKAAAAREGIPYHAVIRRWIQAGIPRKRVGS